MRCHLLRRTKKLVDDHLRAVREVAELRFPDHERHRIGERVAVFKAHHAGFGEVAVVNLELAESLSGV